MKNNYLTLKDKTGKKREYRILFDVEDTNKKLNYVVYTDDKKDNNGIVSAYASSYVLSDKGNMTKMKAIDSEEEFEILSNILESLTQE
jgi:uncharacterized protein YrzB (UPF0473 family)